MVLPSLVLEVLLAIIAEAEEDISRDLNDPGIGSGIKLQSGFAPCTLDHLY